MSINLRIKQLRESEKLSKKDFSLKLGVDNSQYSKIESGKLMPTIQLLMEINSSFNASIDWLLTGKGEMLRQPEATAQEVAYEDKYRALLERHVALQEEHIALQRQLAALLEKMNSIIEHNIS
ncbi:MAG: helix-turn-helix transcriptional regulator [Prevotellaceae bacterium]|jgi:transcriptional regulator with XRE-family HTH domain|nr:helix-turn-helix transcriptional regulator [Prevotellaceae bacterium]